MCFLGTTLKTMLTSKSTVSVSKLPNWFYDPLHFSAQDRIEHGEQRWQTIGQVGGVVLLIVAHTWHESESGTEHIRIISARRATKLERKIYEQGT